jgi:Ca2+-binding RTX toxin-like protein
MTFLSTSFVSTSLYQPIFVYALGDAEDFVDPVASPFSNSSFYTMTPDSYPLGGFYGQYFTTNLAVRGDSRGNFIETGSGNDTVNAGWGDDTVYGNNGVDVIQGGGGNDYIVGGGGVDFLYGGIGNDTIYGGDMVNSAWQPDYWDQIYGGAGNDLMVGGLGADKMNGGSGIDTASYWNAGAAVSVSLSTGAGSAGDAAGDVITNTENLTGSYYGDRLEGNAGVNRIDGGNGADVIEGRSGADTLIGGAGDDTLYGDLFGYGGYADILTGGTGRDTFMFTTLLESGPLASNRDSITDFAAGDKINVQYIDANLGVSGDQAFKLDTGGSFVAGEIRQQKVGADLLLTFNTSGDATPEMSILLKNHAALLTATDFIL